MALKAGGMQLFWNRIESVGIIYVGMEFIQYPANHVFFTDVKKPQQNQN